MNRLNKWNSKVSISMWTFFLLLGSAPCLTWAQNAKHSFNVICESARAANSAQALAYAKNILNISLAAVSNKVSVSTPTVVMTQNPLDSERSAEAVVCVTVEFIQADSKSIKKNK